MAERSDIIILLDRSGSMEQGRADHEGGLRSFAQDALRLAGDVRLTFVRFDSHDPCEVVFEMKPVAEVKPEDLTLVPRGWTPLLDAVGETVTRFADRCPGAVIFMVITDGAENQSGKWTKKKVQELIKEREAAGWKVLYLGANVDAFAEAGAMGVAANAALNYRPDSHSIHAMYAATTSNLTSTYAARGSGMSWTQSLQNMDWTDTQRDSTKPDEKEKK